MPRVKLDELSSYEFHYQVTMRATDINYAGHLGNEALLGLIHDARSTFLQRLGFNTIVKDARQVGLIIADLAVNFKAEAFAHDKLIIDCQIDELGEKSLRLFHRVRRGTQSIALVETGLVAYDYKSRQITRLPQELKQGLERYRK
jgi:acyl-CoA thioesterase FadM